MEQRLSLVTLGVEDLGRSRGFYEALGWRPLSGPEGVVFFQLTGTVFALWSRTSLLEDAGLDPESVKAAPASALAYNCRSRAEVDAIFAEAKAAGAKPLKTPRDAFWGGYSGYFADPDGHLWEVAWNPFWTIDERGGVDATPRPRNDQPKENSQ